MIFLTAFVHDFFVSKSLKNALIKVWERQRSIPSLKGQRQWQNCTAYDIKTDKFRISKLISFASPNLSVCEPQTVQFGGSTLAKVQA